MKKTTFDPVRNLEQTRKRVGWTPRRRTSPQAYARLGFMSGLEIHQQLKTEQKLFCHCPAGIYQDFSEYDAEVVRHMRPTLSELGEYDGTALMEFRTRKTIIYRIRNATTCTYEVDDTPPFPVNRQALAIAMEIALLERTNIVGELHITRKQYLDGSIPTGFQRTAIVGIEGEIPLRRKTVRIIQLSIEEDACREVSDVGHVRTYTTDRLGMPLIETVTYPDMKTPDEVAEAGHYIRFLCRSTGKVRTGIGATRQDVNVSVQGGTRVEIKGVARIARIPELTHNEAFRQKALLEIRADLAARVPDAKAWGMGHRELEHDLLSVDYPPLKEAQERGHRLVAVNLPEFRGLLSFFTQPGQTFADEYGGRLKVIACLEKPNLLHSEMPQPVLGEADWIVVRRLLKAGENDAQILFWAPEADVATALEVIAERSRLAFAGVPNETRQPLPDGTTHFERVLPGPDRMYPDTDSAPIPIGDDWIEQIRAGLPPPVRQRQQQLARWGVPADAHHFLLRHNLMPEVERIIADLGVAPRFAALLFGHRLKHLMGRQRHHAFPFPRVYEMCRYVRDNRLPWDTCLSMLPIVFLHPNMEFPSVLITLRVQNLNREAILAHVPVLLDKFKGISTSRKKDAAVHWVMGQLRGLATANLGLADLCKTVRKEAARD